MIEQFDDRKAHAPAHSYAMPISSLVKVISEVLNTYIVPLNQHWGLDFWALQPKRGSDDFRAGVDVGLGPRGSP